MCTATLLGVSKCNAVTMQSMGLSLKTKKAATLSKAPASGSNITIFGKYSD
jgi:hypothetical protein